MCTEGLGPVIVVGIVGAASAEINPGNTASQFMAPMKLCDYTFLRKGSSHTHVGWMRLWPAEVDSWTD